MRLLYWRRKRISKGSAQPVADTNPIIMEEQCLRKRKLTGRDDVYAHITGSLQNALRMEKRFVVLSMVNVFPWTSAGCGS